jgi:hypothetical protein
MNLGRALSLPSGWSSDARDALGSLGCVAAYLVLGALTLSPLLWAAVPPLVDYPDHLARMWVLLHDKEIPALARNYVVDWRLLPNLAMDLVVPALAQLMPLEAAGRLFIALTMASLVLGTVALHRALHGRIGLWPLASLLFVYNSLLYWGFVNFLFTLGVALLTFAAWVASAGWTAARRAAVFALPASVLFVFHLFGFGVYGMLVASYEFGRLRDERRWTAERLGGAAIHLAQFVPAASLWAMTLGKDRPGYTAYGSLVYKGFAAIAPATFARSPTALDCAVLLLAVCFLCHAKARRALGIAPAMRWPILAMLVAAVLMPDWLYGSWAADLRLPVALAFVAVASLRFADARRTRLATGGFATVALLLLGLRLWAVSHSWGDADRRFAEFRAASRAIPEGARLLVVEAAMAPDEARIDGVPDLLARREPTMFWHMPTLAVIDRSVFVPYFFAIATPVRVNPRNAALTQTRTRLLTPSELIESAAPGWRPSPPDAPDSVVEMPYWIDWSQKFDFVLWIDFAASHAPVPENLQPWARGSFFEIYRIIR